MPAKSTSPVRFTRKEFYDLTVFCQKYALELARYDQDRVNLKECYRFNDRLVRLKAYERLGPALTPVTPARPVARWQILAIIALIWGILALALPNYLSRTWSIVIISGVAFTGIALLFVPEALFGTTMELLQAKVLRVVDTLLEMLNNSDLGFSEAAFFRARENLLAAHAELRQQIDLAHRLPVRTHHGTH